MVQGTSLRVDGRPLSYIHTCHICICMWVVCSFLSEVTYPDHSIWVSRHDDILRVPLIHLRHTAADNLLAPACECVHTHDRVPIDAPHVDVCASAGHNVPLRKREFVTLFTELHSTGLAVRTWVLQLATEWSEVAWNSVLADLDVFIRSFFKNSKLSPCWAPHSCLSFLSSIRLCHPRMRETILIRIVTSSGCGQNLFLLEISIRESSLQLTFYVTNSNTNTIG